MNGMESSVLGFILILGQQSYCLYSFSFIPVGLWISAIAANVKVGIFTLVGMRFRRVVPARVVNPLIKATKQVLRFR